MWEVIYQPNLLQEEM